MLSPGRWSGVLAASVCSAALVACASQDAEQAPAAAPAEDCAAGTSGCAETVATKLEKALLRPEVLLGEPWSSVGAVDPSPTDAFCGLGGYPVADEVVTVDRQWVGPQNRYGAQAVLGFSAPAERTDTLRAAVVWPLRGPTPAKPCPQIDRQVTKIADHIEGEIVDRMVLVTEQQPDGDAVARVYAAVQRGPVTSLVSVTGTREDALRTAEDESFLSSVADAACQAAGPGTPGCLG